MKDSGAGPEPAPLEEDPRFRQSVALFNAGEWYDCHDGFEELWQETLGPDRPVLQGILQIAVAQLHLERGNRNGATVLMGEGLGRLACCGPAELGLDLVSLRECVARRLRCLQQGGDPGGVPLPHLAPAAGPRAGEDL
jgi:hypothetical protein